MNRHNIGIPQQRKGGFSNTTANLQLASVNQAVEHFERVKSRLLEVNDWSKLSKDFSDFRLTDPRGHLKNGSAEEGDYIRIALPAPGLKSTGEYEWVQVEHIINKGNSESDQESLALIVIPSANPNSENNHVAHFFKGDASSTFLVHRQHSFISAEVYGRNEEPNTDVSGIWDFIRNLVISISAILGFSKLQWKLLVRGLVRLPER